MGSNTGKYLLKEIRKFPKSKENKKKKKISQKVSDMSLVLLPLATQTNSLGWEKHFYGQI